MRESTSQHRAVKLGLRNELAQELGTPAVGSQLKFTFELPKADRGDFDATELLRGGDGAQ